MLKIRIKYELKGIKKLIVIDCVWMYDNITINLKVYKEPRLITIPTP